MKVKDSFGELVLVFLLGWEGILRHGSPGIIQLREKASSAEALRLPRECIPSGDEDQEPQPGFTFSLHCFLSSWLLSMRESHQAETLMKEIYWGVQGVEGGTNAGLPALCF